MGTPLTALNHATFPPTPPLDPRKPVKASSFAPVALEAGVRTLIPFGHNALYANLGPFFAMPPVSVVLSRFRAA